MPAADPSPILGSAGERPRRASPPRRRGFNWLWLLLGIVLVALIGGSAWLGSRVLIVKSELEASQGLVRELQAGLQGTDGDLEGSLRALAEHATAAESVTADPVWRLLEPTPVVGDNLRAVRIAAESLRTVSADLAIPLLAAFDAPAGEPLLGRVAGILRDGAPEVTRLTAAAGSALESAYLIDQVRSGLGKVEAVLDRAEPVLRVIPAMLGGEGERNYLLVAQNNAESVGLGGSAASQSQIRVDAEGQLEVIEQADSQDYDNGKAVDVPMEENALYLFGWRLSTYFNTAVSRPDFPTAARTMKAFWERDISPDHIDGVISVDPIALAQVLRATGPIKLAGGEQVTSENAVKLLLSDAYRRSEDADVVDKFFQEVASAVFEQVASGKFEPREMLAAVRTGIDAGNILFWSADEETQKLVATSTVAGILPTSNKNQTVLGVYFRDFSLGSKIDYYMRSAVTVSAGCTPGGRSEFTTKVELHLDISKEAAAKLPEYVRGNAWGSDRYRTQVFIYGPRGTKVTGVELGDRATTWRKAGLVDLKRPVASFVLDTRPGQTTTVTAKFLSSHTDLHGPLGVRTTPMVRPTQIDLDGQPCRAR